MTLATDIASDVDDVFFDTDEFAEAVTYKGTSIDAVVSYGSNSVQEYEYGAKESTMGMTTLIVKKSDVASPAYQDTVTIGSAIYYVQRIIRGNGYTWTLEIRTDERPRLR